jgi:tagaturonate reductase
VKNAMDDPAFAAFVADLMLEEIAPSIPYRLPMQEAREFGLRVLDRFHNPQIQHQWISITMQYSSKIKSRDIPVLLEHYQHHEEPPLHFALGFAAYLLFMRAVNKEQDVWKGSVRGQAYPINDDKAGYYFELWQQHSPSEVVTRALGDKSLWGTDLTRLSGFEEAVRQQLDILMEKGAVTALTALATKKSIV